MSPSFDPYYTWLGIPPDEQPPNHYRLLGLKVFESNEEAISHAGDRQMMLLRTFQSGKHSALSQELLNRIAAARICLLNAEKKAAYDAQLQQELGGNQAASAHAPSARADRVSAGAVPDAEPPSFDLRPVISDRDRHLGRRRRGKSLLDKLVGAGWKVQLALGAAVVASFLLGGVVLFLPSPPQVDLPPEAPGPGTVGENKPREVPSDVRPPELAPIADRTIQVGQPLQLTVEIKDPGVQHGGLAFHLERPSPEGMQIDRRTGQITWQPGEEQLPGEYPVIVTVTSDAAGDLKARQSFSIRLDAANEPVVPPKSMLADRPSQPTDSDRPMPDKPTAEPMPPKSAPQTIASEEKPSPKPAAQRQPVPDKPARAKSLLAVKERFKKAYASSKPHVRLALAAQLIGESRKAEDATTERYVLLDEARSLAAREGDLVLGMIAADELARDFQVDSVVLKVEAVRSSIRTARTTAALRPVIETASLLACEGLTTDSFGDALSLLSEVISAARKTGGANLSNSVLERRSLAQFARKMYVESRPAAATLADDPLDAKANLTLGRFYCLASEDWEAGLAMLAKGNDEVLKEHAAKLVANSSDTVAQLDLADVWWEMAESLRGTSEEKTLLIGAARHWYSQAAPRLGGDDLVKARARLGSVGSQRPRTARRPYRIPLGGLAGLSILPPEKFSGEVAPGGGFANFLGKGSLEYAQIPAVSYIHEFELTFAKPQGSLQLRYGGAYRGAKINFVWMAEQGVFRCRVHRYRGGTVYWGGERNYRVGEKLRFTFYVNEDTQVLCQNDIHVRSTNSRPADLRLIVSSGAGTAVNVSHCAFRPWAEADAQSRKCPMPPGRVEGNLTETALQWHARNIDLGDRPIPADPEPFVVGTTGTPMQWAAAGTFQRVYADANPPKPPTQVNITLGFWIGRCEITQAEWARLMPLRVSRVTGSPLLPVDGVRWEDAAKFCLLLTEREKKTRRLPSGYLYRLPTEAEWEYACRAGSAEDFCTGTNDFWSKERSNWRPHEVGTSSANRWGIFDMHGNVAEWCCEMWQDVPAKPPARLVDPFRPPSGDTSLLCWRGGNWWQPQAFSSCRKRDSDRSEAAGHTGLRIVLGPALRAK